MEEKLHGIVLSKIKHSDKANILIVYTKTRGRMAFIAPIGTGKTQKMKNVLYQPLSIVEIVADVKKNSELHRIKQITLRSVYKDLYFNPLKNIIGIFIADFLNRVLREAPPDRNLWQYIVDSCLFFDMTHQGIANFHITFLYGVGMFMGIQPDLTTYIPGSVLDMQSGCYRHTLPSHSHYIKGKEAELPLLLERMNFTNFHLFRFTGQERSRILEMMIEYYDLHIPGVASMKSFDVLKTMFA